jgi:uncharacterized RDD family membrane protein YckC
MRCPKCHYISYDSNGRCRNCGYEFSLAVDAPEVELPIQTGDEPIGPLGDLPLAAASVTAEPTPAPESQSGRARAARAARAAAAPRRSATDLPLFKDRAPDTDPPFASTPAPRAPLSVRRAQPAPPRVTPPMPAPAFRLEVPEPLPVPYAESDPEAGLEERAGAVRRLLAGIIDMLVLGSIDIGVVYLTLQICGFSFIEVLLLPPVPLLAFLLLLDGGYLTAFTAAGGQTLGKMATGIKVVSLGEDPRVRPRNAVLRSAGYLVSALPAGLGFLPALFGSDGRAVHDRLADTRVIRA